MRITQQICIMRHRLRGLGCPPDTVIAGPAIFDELVRECALFHTADAFNNSAVPVPVLLDAAVHLFDMRVYKSDEVPPHSLFIGIGIKP